ncbi:iron-sulfur cluster insertion protein ErpA [Niveispirillum sp. KHB5.9]|uniref:iron-sulfur cluster insertion protein ErpA n=1 Tax=Niveispirillum sp. KHB5.9 TaxID=3400269 RepID=UPI003A863A84
MSTSTTVADGTRTPPPEGRAMTLSASAARRIAKLATLEGNPDQMLRLTVSGGGCSGFQYGFSFDTNTNDDDHVFTRDGAKLVVDDVSLDLLAGAELDFAEDLMGSYFKVVNPNAASSCGCGTSFSV